MRQDNVPDMRIRCVNDRSVRQDGRFVLYRMLAFRRFGWNFALQHAANQARLLQKPLVVYEEIPLSAPWLSRRSLTFILDGVRDHLQIVEDLPVVYCPFLERHSGEATDLLAELCRAACLLVEDDSPVENSRSNPARGVADLTCRVEAVDSNGLLPLRAAEQVFATAYSFRRFLHKTLPSHLLQLPEASSCVGLPPIDLDPLDAGLREKWRFLTAADIDIREPLWRGLSINQQVVPTGEAGGCCAANRQWRLFLKERLDNYPEARNQPELLGSSEMSAYLRHGQISTHQMFHDLAEREDWSLQRLAPRPTGRRNGWWGVSAETEAFLDELVTWRELGYNMAAHRDDYREYTALPDWAQQSLAKHAGDVRPVIYGLEQFEQAATHDPLWNAAQIQLQTEGRIHNYLRMLWGKKILEWSLSPQDAAATMIELNNRYALDGCDPNSYSGIYWCLGRYDRAWGPERPIFGKIRYMSSENTARKYAVKDYIRRYQG